MYDGRQELEQYAGQGSSNVASAGRAGATSQKTLTENDHNAWFHKWLERKGVSHNTSSEEGMTAYRKLVYLPNEVAGIYGQLLSQELFTSTRNEFKFGYSGNGFAWGHHNGNNQKHFASKLYFSQDAQNSTIKVSGSNVNGEGSENSWRYAYTPFGQAYGFDKRRNNAWRNKFYGTGYLNNHVVPYLYTGKYTDPLTNLVNMDARWYDARTARFVQQDQYNHANLMLPAGAQSELMRYIGRTQNDLLKDPAQQMRYGYASGNALRWTDPLGLCYPERHGVEPIVVSGGYNGYGETRYTYENRDGSAYDVVNNPNTYDPDQMKKVVEGWVGLTGVGGVALAGIEIYQTGLSVGIVAGAVVDRVPVVGDYLRKLIPKGVKSKTDNSLENVGDLTIVETKQIQDVAKSVPGRGYHKEVFGNKPVKPQDATNKWDEFLGQGTLTNTHPRTGQVDPDRIVSADGKRSIRYGSHEMGSKPTKHHYHEETWSLDSVNNVMNVDNTVIRVPLPKN